MVFGTPGPQGYYSFVYAPEGPGTQYSTFLVSKPIPSMDFGTKRPHMLDTWTLEVPYGLRYHVLRGFRPESILFTLEELSAYLAAAPKGQKYPNMKYIWYFLSEMVVLVWGRCFIFRYLDP